MAVSAHSIVVMTSEDHHRTVHPFFENTFRTRTSTPNLTERRSSPPSLHYPTVEPIETTHEVRNVAAATEPDKSEGEIDCQSEVILTSKIEPERPGASSAVVSEHDEMLKEAGLSPGRRKRRKLTPNAKDVPSHQDEHFGFTDGSPKSQSIAIPFTPKAVPSVVEHQQLRSSPPERDTTANEPTTLSSPNYTANETSSPINPSQPSISGNILLLNGKGAFKSPKSKKRLHKKDGDAVSQSPKAKARKHKPVTGRVVLKYGKDVSDRSRIGEQIRKILSGSISLRSSSNLEEPKPSLQASQASKITHPFFLGKVTPKVEFEAQRISSGSEEKQDEHLPHANTRSFTTPKKLKQPGNTFGATSHQETVVDQTKEFGRARSFNLPGTFEPAWPWVGAARSLDNSQWEGVKTSIQRGNLPFRTRKLKYQPMFIQPEEDVVSTLSNRLNFSHGSSLNGTGSGNVSSKELRLPKRRLLSCKKAHDHASSQLSPSFNRHPQITFLLSILDSSLSTYDRSENAFTSWAQKYSPKSSKEVLQSTTEVRVLKSWLESLTVDAVHKTSVVDGQGKGATSLYSTKARGRRKRQKKHELDDFIVSSDDEAIEMRTLSNDETDSAMAVDSNYSVIRNVEGLQKSSQSNAILLSGPHGCGKTAMVYAVAKELGFDVFEINPGSRRSGKDLLDRVGDMTFNHQVRKSRNHIEEKDEDTSEITLTAVVDDQQKSLTSFFGKAQKTAKVRKGLQKATQALKQPDRKSQRQNQSLILLEEVDLLFEEDKQFWETVIGLASTSKRPLIMTCNNELLVPADSLSLHAILRLKPQAVDLVADYLLLVAALEGHLLERKAVTDLYRTKKLDLRASITELSFWCQMGIGDKKGGLEWLYQRWPPGSDFDDDGKVLRVMSQDTFHAGMGWVNPADILDATQVDHRQEEDLVRNIAIEKDSDIIDLLEFDWEEQIEQDVAMVRTISEDRNLQSLVDFELCAEYCSDADMLNKTERPGRALISDSLDPTEPPVAAKSRSDFITGYRLLDATVKTSHTTIDNTIASMLQTRAWQGWQRAHSQSQSHNRLRSVPETILRILPCHQSPSQQLNRNEFTRAFEAIAGQPDALGGSAFEFQACSFDRNFRLVVEDLAPYVRMIVAFDLKLEEQRLRLSGVGSKEEADGKRLRTTRASRSALEGSQRANTRRERWFSKAMDTRLALRTGGIGWQRDFEPEQSPNSTRNSSEGL